jgi:hypothetical protein
MCVSRIQGSDGLGTGQPEFDSRQRQEKFFARSFRTDSGAHPASYANVTEGFFPRGKAAEA